MNAPTDKSELRREARKRRRNIPESVRAQAQHDIAGWIEERVARCGWRYIAAYAGAASEVRLDPWFDQVGSDIELSLPAIDSQGVMTFRRWSPGEPLVTGPFSIEQPKPEAAAIALASQDVVLLPLLGFDHCGLRLGSGAGYYDRAFAFRRANDCSPQLIGVAFAVQEFDRLPRDAWDVTLDAVVTERGWIDFQRTSQRNSIR